VLCGRKIIRVVGEKDDPTLAHGALDVERIAFPAKRPAVRRFFRVCRTD